MNLDLHKFIAEWRKNENNLSLPPKNVETIRQRFNKNYPKENLTQLTIDDYGRRSDSFCKLIEFGLKLHYLRGITKDYDDHILKKSHNEYSINDSIFWKYGVYWSTLNNKWLWYESFDKQTAIEALEDIKCGLEMLINAVEEGNIEQLDQIISKYLNQEYKGFPNQKPLHFLGLATLYFYYPKRFIPIFEKQILDDKLNAFGLSIPNGLVAKNLKLLNHLKSFPEFDDFNTWEMMHFIKDFNTIKTINNHHVWEILKQKTGQSSDFLMLLDRTIKRKKQIILTGCPGSGKTYLANQFAQYLTREMDGLIEIVQFHPAYTYEDFIQGLRPDTDENNNLIYRVIPGRFLEFCDQARQRKGNCVLIIDEINRANLAAVFGELMYLLEYRDRQIKLAGSSQGFSIPNNVYLIGTMNTADRSIALVDHALRRRFAFIELRPNYEILLNWHQQKQTDFPIEALIIILKKLNHVIDDHHYHLGISFFLDEQLTENIADIWTLEIIPYLEEVFYDSPDKLKEFLWGNINNEIFK